MELLQKDIAKNVKEIERVKQNGAEALAEFQERVIEANRKFELAIEENRVLRERDDKIRSRLVITNDDEFNWAAVVIDRARKNLAIDASLRNEDTLLINDLIHEREGFDLPFFSADSSS